MSGGVVRTHTLIQVEKIGRDYWGVEGSFGLGLSGRGTGTEGSTKRVWKELFHLACWLYMHFRSLSRLKDLTGLNLVPSCADSLSFGPQWWNNGKNVTHRAGNISIPAAQSPPAPVTCSFALVCVLYQVYLGPLACIDNGVTSSMRVICVIRLQRAISHQNWQKFRPLCNVHLFMLCSTTLHRKPKHNQHQDGRARHGRH